MSRPPGIRNCDHPGEAPVHAPAPGGRRRRAEACQQERRDDDAEDARMRVSAPGAVQRRYTPAAKASSVGSQSRQPPVRASRGRPAPPRALSSPGRIFRSDRSPSSGSGPSRPRWWSRSARRRRSRPPARARSPAACRGRPAASCAAGPLRRRASRSSAPRPAAPPRRPPSAPTPRSQTAPTTSAGWHSRFRSSHDGSAACPGASGAKRPRIHLASRPAGSAAATGRP